MKKANKKKRTIPTIETKNCPSIKIYFYKKSIVIRLSKQFDYNVSRRLSQYFWLNLHIFVFLKNKFLILPSRPKPLLFCFIFSFFALILYYANCSRQSLPYGVSQCYRLSTGFCFSKAFDYFVFFHFIVCAFKKKKMIITAALKTTTTKTKATTFTL